MARACRDDLPDRHSRIFFQPGLDRANHLETVAENRAWPQRLFAQQSRRGANAHGSFTKFGGCRKDKPNYLTTMAGW
jgi:hypothetical protein